MPERGGASVAEVGDRSAPPADSTLVDLVGAAILAPSGDQGRPDLDPEDPAHHLRIVARSSQAEQVARDLLRQSVAAARSHGHSWAAIGGVLGLTRQAAQQRFGDRRDAGGADAAAPARRTLGPVTAFDEMGELALAGDLGWHTIGVGMFTHTMVRTATRWEHRRVVWTGPTSRFTRDGWAVGARSFPWLYLIRDTGEPAKASADAGE